MPALRTEITEIVTGLGMLGFRDLDDVIEIGPSAVANVTADHYRSLGEARAAGEYSAEFATAWENGQVFARAADGLRGRPPWQVEWKGRHRPPGYEQIPADLRVDHVFLISCKYGSRILHNVSPAHLVDHLLVERPTGRPGDWYETVAPEQYQEFYAACRGEIGGRGLPAGLGDLTTEQRIILKNELAGTWPAELRAGYAFLCSAVATATADRWTAQLSSPARREQLLWRLLRFQAAPYFILGADPTGVPLRYRVATPWDFRDRFDLDSFSVWAAPAGQPRVDWRAGVTDRLSGEQVGVDGHVEVRWSHGRFRQPPEAKVYLDTPAGSVPGYFGLE